MVFLWALQVDNEQYSENALVMLGYFNRILKTHLNSIYTATPGFASTQFSTVCKYDANLKNHFPTNAHIYVQSLHTFKNLQCETD